MDNYIINENTVAVLKKDNKTIIYDVENQRVINKSIKSVLNMNCSFYGSSLSGRIKSASKILNIKYKVPIVINENNLILMQLKSLRSIDTILLVSNKVIKYEERDSKLVLNISKNSFEKMLLNSFLLNNVLKWQKSVNFV